MPIVVSLFHVWRHDCSPPRAHVNSVSVTLPHLFLSGQLYRSVQCLVSTVVSTVQCPPVFEEVDLVIPPTNHPPPPTQAWRCLQRKRQEQWIYCCSSSPPFLYELILGGNILNFCGEFELICSSSQPQTCLHLFLQHLCVLSYSPKCWLLLSRDGGFSSKLSSMICYLPFTLDISNLSPIIWLMVQKNIQQYIS